MKTILFLAPTAFFALSSCNPTSIKTEETAKTNRDSVFVIGAMHHVMHEGKLAGTIALDTIKEKSHLYGLGPMEYLSGELMILDGKSYSSVVKDSGMVVSESYSERAPFFVYSHVDQWDEITLPHHVVDLKSLEGYVDSISTQNRRPFAFKLEGKIQDATIHVVNLPKGSTVNSPEEAHRGQKNFPVSRAEVDILGFFSTEHQAVFTHHDTFMHLHLITRDRSMMGHVDHLQFESKEIKLYLPRQ